MPRVPIETISGEELRRRIDALRPCNYVEAAAWLGLSRDGLAKAFAGKRPVGKQTQIILRHLEDKRAMADYFTAKFKKSITKLTKTLNELT